MLVGTCSHADAHVVLPPATQNVSGIDRDIINVTTRKRTHGNGERHNLPQSSESTMTTENRHVRQTRRGAGEEQRRCLYTVRHHTTHDSDQHSAGSATGISAEQ